MLITKTNQGMARGKGIARFLVGRFIGSVRSSAFVSCNLITKVDSIPAKSLRTQIITLGFRLSYCSLATLTR